MPALELDATQRKLHRAAAHHLHPVVMVGAGGLTEAVVREVDAALVAHELVKVRAMLDDRAARDEMLATLAAQLGAAPVQHIGKLLVLWRPAPPKEAPGRAERDERGRGPRVVKVVKFSKSGNHRATVKKVKVLGNQRITAAGKIKRLKPRAASVKKKTA
ncbi:MAG: YhbY family RNA-binding protein [Burkholderiales bacterium]|nr:YhbY family RNA-binding protein [Burkholderiales bacterium]